MDAMQRGFRADTAADALELMIYGPLGMGDGPQVVQAGAVVTAIQEYAGRTIRVYINSPGGVVYEGLSIYNALKRHPARKEVYIDGVCASAATIVAMAGDRIAAADNAMLMVHAVWNQVGGNAEDLRREAGVLDTLTETLVNLYVERTRRSREEVARWVADETWFTAAEAKAVGLIDEITSARTAVAVWDYAAFGLPNPGCAGRPATLDGLRQEVAELRSQVTRLTAGGGSPTAAALRETFSEWLEDFKDAALEALSASDFREAAAAFRADYDPDPSESADVSDDPPAGSGGDAPLGELLARVKGGPR
jgi:ATP-dependent Clp protease, protease subunit